MTNGTPQAAAKNAPAAAPTQQSVFDRLLQAINNTLELEIVTAVSDFTIDHFDDPKNAMKIDLGTKPKGYVTSVNLLTGDIRNVISPAYSAGQNKELQDFHTTQVALAREIIATNLKMVGELAEKVRSWIKEDEAESGGG
ncbi:MAG: hypothetical protein GY791_02425 [Alphaproteobacteria bacterium]|nr:hypothetical protein [Alphaproteobacteria bacterium]